MKGEGCRSVVFKLRVRGEWKLDPCGLLPKAARQQFLEAWGAPLVDSCPLQEAPQTGVPAVAGAAAEPIGADEPAIGEN